MASNLGEVIEILDFANKIIGSIKEITINSGICKHDDKKGDGINYLFKFSDVIKIFNKNKKQFANTYEERSYIFEGIEINKKKNYFVYVKLFYIFV